MPANVARHMQEQAIKMASLTRETKARQLRSNIEGKAHSKRDPE